MTRLSSSPGAVATFQETTTRECLAPSCVNSGSLNMPGLFSAMPTVSLACAAAGSASSDEEGDQEEREAGAHDAAA